MFIRVSVIFQVLSFVCFGIIILKKKTESEVYIYVYKIPHKAEQNEN